MFDLFKKKSPDDEYIKAMYGSRPQKNVADSAEAAVIAYDDLLGGLLLLEDVGLYCFDLARTSIPYSTNDLAVNTALKFFRDEEMIFHLREVQVTARMKATQWIADGLLNKNIASHFEKTLYEFYKSEKVEKAREKFEARIRPVNSDSTKFLDREFSLVGQELLKLPTNHRGLVAYVIGVTKSIAQKRILNQHETGLAIKFQLEKRFSMNFPTMKQYLEPSGEIKIPNGWEHAFAVGNSIAEKIYSSQEEATSAHGELLKCLLTL